MLASRFADFRRTSVRAVTDPARPCRSSRAAVRVTFPEGFPGVEVSYQLSSSGEGTIYGSQLEVMPKPDKACAVAVTVGEGQSAGNILNVAAATAQFP